MKITISWGNRLLLVFVVFAGMISFMVYRCMLTPVDLVAKEYYKDELSYQEVIDARKHAESLAGKVRLRQTGKDVIVTLPAEMKHVETKGTIQFYCPSDAGKDRRFELNAGAADGQIISTRLVLPGYYTVRIQWDCRGVRYFDESAFVVL
jgi:hypothetical protein